MVDPDRDAPDDASIFERDGSRFVPRPIAAGPWSPDALHGGPPTALVGRLMLAHEPGDTDWFLTRLTTELIRPVPMAPLEVRVETIRPGRRVQLLDAVVVDPDGTEVLWARGLRIEQSVTAVDESILHLPTPPTAPEPATLSRVALIRDLPWVAFGAAFDFRPITGLAFAELGPASVWSRLLLPLFPGESIHPLDRVLTLADFPNGVGNAVSFESFSYINPDLTVALHRLPEDEWVLLDAHTHARSSGHGTAQGTIADRHGALATAIQSLLIRDR